MATHRRRKEDVPLGDNLPDVIENPYQALAVAASLGFVLGNGVWKHLMHLAFGMGTRFVLQAALAQTRQAEVGLNGSLSQESGEDSQEGFQ